MKIFLCLFLIFGIVACAGGGDSGDIITNQTILNSQVGGDVNNLSIGSSTEGSGGTITTDVRVDIRLAIDPTAFTELFGNVVKISNPSSGQLNKIAAYAVRQGNQKLINDVKACAFKDVMCEIVRN